MDDFGFDFDFNMINRLTETKINYVQTDICGLVEKMRKKERHLFNIGKEVGQLDALIGQLPNQNEVYKMLSVGGGFSSLAIIKLVAEKETIDELYVSTFRIGKNHFNVLCELQNAGLIKKASFVTSQSQEMIDKKASYKGSEYNYYDFIVAKCNEFGWKIKSFDNHSKLILMKTKNNWYVVETSSNLNENPKMEQFSFENDKELFSWYKNLFAELLR